MKQNFQSYSVLRIRYAAMLVFSLAAMLIAPALCGNGEAKAQEYFSWDENGVSSENSPMEWSGQIWKEHIGELKIPDGYDFRDGYLWNIETDEPLVDEDGEPIQPEVLNEQYIDASSPTVGDVTIEEGHYVKNTQTSFALKSLTVKGYLEIKSGATITANYVKVGTLKVSRSGELVVNIDGGTNKNFQLPFIKQASLIEGTLRIKLHNGVNYNLVAAYWEDGRNIEIEGTDSQCTAQIKTNSSVNNLVVSGCTLKISNSFTVKGNLTVRNNGKVKVTSGGSLNVSGNINVESGSSIEGVSKDEVTMNGSGFAIDYSGVAIAEGGSLTILNGAMELASGTLTVPAGASLTVDDGSLTVADGVTIAANGSVEGISVGSQSGTISGSGFELSTSGLTVSENGEFNPTSAFEVTGNIDASGSIGAPGIVNGDITLSGSAFAVHEYTGLTVSDGGSLTMSCGQYASVAKLTVGNNCTLKINSASPLNVVGDIEVGSAEIKGSGGIKKDNLVYSGNGFVVDKTGITVNNGGALTVDNAEGVSVSSLTVNAGTINVNGNALKVDLDVTVDAGGSVGPLGIVKELGDSKSIVLSGSGFTYNGNAGGLSVTGPTTLYAPSEITINSGSLVVSSSGVLTVSDNSERIIISNVDVTVDGELRGRGLSYTTTTAYASVTGKSFVLTSSALTINQGGWLAVSGSPLEITGNLELNGNVTSGGIFLKGQNPQTISGNATSISNLTVKNASGVTVNADITITETLTLTSGKLAVGGNHIYMAPGATVNETGDGFVHTDLNAGGFGYKFDAQHTLSRLYFPLATMYSGSLVATPAVFSFSSASVSADGGSLMVNVNSGSHSALTDDQKATSLTCYWAVTSEGLSGISGSATFTAGGNFITPFGEADLNENSLLYSDKQSKWVKYEDLCGHAGDKINISFTLSGTSEDLNGDYLCTNTSTEFTEAKVIPMLVWKGGAGTDWNNVLNWSNGQQLPSKKDNVIIPDGCANYPVITGNNPVVAADVLIEGGGKITVGQKHTAGIFECDNLIIEQNAAGKSGGCIVQMSDDAMSTFFVKHKIVNMAGVQVEQTVKAGNLERECKVFAHDDNGAVIGGSATQNIVVQRHFTTGRDWYVGPAVTNGTNQYAENNFGYKDSLLVYKKYAELEDGTYGVKYENEAFKTKYDSYAIGDGVGKFYLHPQKTENGTIYKLRTVNQRGEIFNEAQKEFTLTREEGQTGWELLYNPYPFAINLENTGSFQMSDNANPTIYMRVVYNNAFVWATYGIGDDGTVMPVNSNDKTIPPFQAFFASLPEDQVGETGTVTITKPSSTEGVYTGSVALKSATIETVSPIALAYLTLDSESGSDQTVVVFKNGDETAWVRGDADKMFERSIPQLYQLKQNKQLVISRMPSVSDLTTVTIPLGVYVPGGKGEVTIRFDNPELFESGIKAYLIDNAREAGDQLIDLEANGAYTFATTQVTDESRFALKFVAAEDNANVGGNYQGKPTDTQSLADDIDTDITVESAAGYATVAIGKGLLNQGAATVAVYDMRGAVVATSAVSDTRVKVSVPQTGVYVVRVSAAGKVVSKKFLGSQR